MFQKSCLWEGFVWCTVWLCRAKWLWFSRSKWLWSRPFAHSCKITYADSSIPVCPALAYFFSKCWCELTQVSWHQDLSGLQQATAPRLQAASVAVFCVWRAASVVACCGELTLWRRCQEILVTQSPGGARPWNLSCSSSCRCIHFDFGHKFWHWKSLKASSLRLYECQKLRFSEAH